MAEFNESSQKNDSVNGSVPLVLEETIQNDIPCNVDPKLTETEDIPGKENTSIKYEEISELKELFKKNDSVNGDRPGKNNIENDLNCEVDEKLSETENVSDKENVGMLKEEIKLLKLTSDLQDVIINLLQQKLKLLDIKNRQFKNYLIKSVEDIQKGVDETLGNFLISSEDLPLSELQNILKIVESTNTGLEKDLMDDIEQILAETHSKFLKYQEIYKTCKTYLENFLQKAEKILNVPHSSQIKRSALFSILEDLLSRLNNFRLVSIKKAFDEFETIIINYTKMNVENIGKIDLLLAAFEKAELAYRQLKLLTVEVLQFDFAEV